MDQQRTGRPQNKTYSNPSPLDSRDREARNNGYQGLPNSVDAGGRLDEIDVQRRIREEARSLHALGSGDDNYQS